MDRLDTWPLSLLGVEVPMKYGLAFGMLFASGLAACSSGESPLTTDGDAAPPTPGADAGATGGQNDSGAPPPSDAGSDADASTPPTTLALLPATVDWSDVTVGAAGSVVDVGVTNMGQAVSTTLSASLGGTEASSWEIVTDACSGKTIAPLANCLIQLRFRPMTNGALGAGLFVRAGTAILSSSLTGRGIGQPRFSVTPSPYEFDTTAVNKPGAHVFTVTNAGDLPSGAPTFSVGGDTTSFQVLADQTFTCTHGLAAAESCNVKVIFTPPNAGAKAGSFEVKGDPGIGALVPLRGLAKLPANLEQPVSSFVFASTQSGVPGVAKEFVFTNTGEWETDPISVYLDGVDAAQYDKVADTCTGAKVAPNATCSVTLQPNPSSTGFKHAQLIVSPRAIDLGYAANAAPALVLSPSTWHFGSVQSGAQSSLQTFVLTNPGLTATGALGVALAGTDAAQFQIAQNNCPNVGAGASCNVRVRFLPAGTGSRTAFLQVTGAGGAQSSLTGSAVAPSSLRFDVTSASFDTIKAGKTSAPITFTLTNAGGVTSGILSTGINGVGWFSIAQDNCTNTTLAPGASCTVTVVFSTTSDGEKRATLDATDGVSTASVALGGTCDARYLLTASVTGSGSIGGPGIDCPSDCSEVIGFGNVRSLVPIVPEGSVFSGWTGCTQVNGNECIVMMDQDRSVTATFTKKILNVTVTTVGTAGATGTVTSSLPGINCSAPQCASGFSYGSNVVLTATPSAGSTFEGWSGACTGTEPTCRVSVTEARGVTAYFTRANIVFVTSTKHVAGSIGGVAGGDAICQARASAAGLAGTYKAWLPTASTSAIAHLTGAFAPRGFVRTDGKPFADSLAALAEGEVFYPIALNELGQPVGSASVVTGANGMGYAAGLGATCDDWTNASPSKPFFAGVATGGTDAWTYSRYASGEGRHFPNCSEEGRLYCFGTDYRGALPRPSGVGRRAFISDAYLSATAGIAGADALCSSEAAAAGLSGTFKAFLATTTASAISRVSTVGAPWFRTDGVQLVQAASSLAGETLMASLNVTAAGKYRGRHGVPGYANAYVWAGAVNPSAVARIGDTCEDWTQHYDRTIEGPQGLVGLGIMADDAFFGIEPMQMDNCVGLPIYCFEQ